MLYKQRLLLAASDKLTLKYLQCNCLQENHKKGYCNEDDAVKKRNYYDAEGLAFSL